MEELKINGTFLLQFESHSQWVNKAASWFKPHRLKPTICLAKDGSVVHIGEDFKLCKDWDLFPVKVYELERTAKTGNYF